tara:strand:+ start:447 stop:929 length:483 start_codon:yes stop_codon:yes gene_type:complete
MSRTVEIEIPKGMEVDEKNSTFTRIVFKEIKSEPKIWAELSALPGYFIDKDSNIIQVSAIGGLPRPVTANRNIFPTEADAESSLALAQLLQVRKDYIGDWEADWGDEDEYKYIICRISNAIDLDHWCMRYHELSFPTRDMRDEFMKNNMSLLKTYFKLYY